MKKKMKRHRVNSSHRAVELESNKRLALAVPETQKAPSVHDAECSPIIFDDSELSEEEKKPETPFRTNNNSISQMEKLLEPDEDKEEE